MAEKYQSHGEISLAHCGILFLDELPEFNRNVLEVLRGPLEDRNILISRVNASISYPCNFMLIASMNPCPCGFYGSQEKECTCNLKTIQKYMGKISGPLLDRIDIQIEVTSVKYDKLQSEKEQEFELFGEKKKNEKTKVTSKYKEIFNLIEKEDLNINEIARELNVNIAELNMKLTMMELENLIEIKPGGIIKRNYVL